MRVIHVLTGSIAALFAIQVHAAPQAEKKNELLLSSTTANLNTTGDTDLALQVGYGYFVTEMIEAVGTGTFQWTDPEAEAADNITAWSVTAGPRINIGNDASSAIWAGGRIGLFDSGNPLADTDFVWLVEVGKRMPLFGSGVSWNPNVSLSKSGDADEQFNITPLAFSLLW